jgi:hypothetical protein
VRNGLESNLTQGSAKTKHMSKLLRVKHGSKTILAKFGDLSPSNLITRAYLAKKEGKTN